MDAWLKPMLCTPVDSVPTGDFIAEGKLDGWRLLIHSTGRECRTFGGRNASDYSGKLPYVEREIVECLPPDTAVDGEIVAANWGDVQSAMTKGGPHVPTLASPALTFYVFDILRCNGQDVRSLPWHERRTLLEAATFIEHVRLVHVHPCNRRAFQVAVATGFEGIVCKERSSTYASGVRSPAWAKLKAEWTCEARVLDFYWGTGSNASRLGALEVEQLDESDRSVMVDGRHVYGRVGGGFTDTQRQEIIDHFDGHWRGAIVEIKHNGVMESGKLRHPTFVRRRDDKAPPRPTPSPPKKSRPGASRHAGSGSWMRNYGAMSAPKLKSVLDDFARGHGDAVQRVMTHGGDLALHISRAVTAAHAKAIPIPPALRGVPRV